MTVLMVGDVVGGPGRRILRRELKGLKARFGAAAAVVNAENCAAGSGITAALAEEIFDAGADAITLGDHTWGQREFAAQIGGVDRSTRKTTAKLAKDSKLVIRERLLTELDQTADTDFYVEMNGENSGVNLISRSVARDNSRQSYRSIVIGNAPCTGHTECDAIISENGIVDAAPELRAHNGDAALIHEAAIGKIAGEQILKLRTLGLTESEAEQTIIDGFLS